MVKSIWSFTRLCRKPRVLPVDVRPPQSLRDEGGCASAGSVVGEGATGYAHGTPHRHKNI
jgi:hypothetical protein